MKYVLFTLAVIFVGCGSAPANKKEPVIHAQANVGNLEDVAYQRLVNGDYTIEQLKFLREELDKIEGPSLWKARWYNAIAEKELRLLAEMK